MADYISREVARERLRKTCKAGTAISLIVLLLGLLYAGVTAVIMLELSLPDIVSTVLHAVVPSMDAANVAVPECISKGILFILMGFVGLLMFHKMAKTGDAFRLGQMRQFRFIAVLAMMLGFVPTLAINITEIVMVLRSGASPFTVLTPDMLDIDVLCIIAGLMMLVVARVLVSGAELGSQEEELARTAPEVLSEREPSFADVPDLSNVPTAQETVAMTDSSLSEF